MIYADNENNSSQEFENLLQRTKLLVEEYLKEQQDPTKITGQEFESIVCEKAQEAAKNTWFEGKLRQTKDREFPDIVDDEFFGIEVKATVKDDWTSIGNSVLESSRIPNTKKIYIVFGKLGGVPEVRYKNYEECLKGIAVTHYPRYQIDMALSDGQSIFDLMEVTYSDLRTQQNPVAAIRSYYSSKLRPGQALWWVNDNIDDSTTPTPIIRRFTDLEYEEKQKVIAEILVIFPEVFSGSRSKYKRVAPYLTSRFGIITPNLRDKFSAGGAARITGPNISTVLPHVVGEMISAAQLIEDMWSESVIKSATSREGWLSEIDAYNDEIKLSDLYVLALGGELNVAYVPE